MNVRSRWANETKELFADILRQQQALTEQVKRLKTECNHTYPSGDSAIVEGEENDGPGPWDYGKYRRCSVCGTGC